MLEVDGELLNLQGKSPILIFLLWTSTFFSALGVTTEVKIGEICLLIWVRSSL